MSSRHMSLLPRAALRRDREQEVSFLIKNCIECEDKGNVSEQNEKKLCESHHWLKIFLLKTIDLINVFYS
jgi:hypothetical protein